MPAQKMPAKEIRRPHKPYGFSWRIALPLTLYWLLAACCVGAAFHTLQWDLDSHPQWLWGSVACFACTGGAWAAYRSASMPGWTLAFASSTVVAIAGVLAASAGWAEGFTSAPMRALLVAPAAIGLCAYFGASLGYLVFAGDLGVGFEADIGRRFLLSKASPVLSTVTGISLVGVSLGVWLVLVSLAVLSGFEQDLRAKILGGASHLLLEDSRSRFFVLDPKAQAALKNHPQALATSSFVAGDVALASSSNYGGALLYGIDPKQARKVLTLFDTLSSGSLAPLQNELESHTFKSKSAQNRATPTGFAPPAPIPHMVIGSELAKILHADVGDTVRAVSPILEVVTPVGTLPKSAVFKVAGIFSSGMYAHDARYAYISLAAARRFLEAPQDALSGVHIRTPDAEQAHLAQKPLLEAMHNAAHPTALHVDRVDDRHAQDRQATPSKLKLSDWRQRNRTLFASLKQERVVAFIVLVFVILVASFSIVNTLTMSVIEKRAHIAILKTLGASNGSIMKLFLSQGLWVGGIGIVVGSLLAMLTVFWLKTTGFGIPSDVYYIDALPVSLRGQDVLLVAMAALLIVWNFAVFPALRGAGLHPVEGLRHG